MKEEEVFFRDPFQLPSNGAALGIEVEIPRAKNDPLVLPYQKKYEDGSDAGTLLLPTRDADCLAESSFFHLECDGSTYNPGRKNMESALKAAVTGYIGLMDDTESQILIDGTWNGAASQKEEAGHWGYGCLIEIVGHPLSTDPRQADLHVGMLNAVAQIKAAIEATVKGDKTLVTMVNNYNKGLSNQKKASGWKLALPCNKHQRRIARQDFSLKGTPWAVPENLGKDELPGEQQQGFPLPMVFEGRGQPNPKTAQVTIGVPLATLGCPRVAAKYDLAQLGCTQHVQFRADADQLAAAMGLDAPEEVGVVTLFLYFYDVIKHNKGKHGIEFLFKSAAKDLVRQHGVLSEKGLLKLSWAAKDIKLNDKELNEMILTHARRVGRSRTLRGLLHSKEISVNDWLSIFEPRQSNSDRYPGETDDQFGTSVLTKVRKEKKWVGHPHFAPLLAFTMNGQWSIAVESRDSKATLNKDFSMYEDASRKNTGKDQRKEVIKSWLFKIQQIQDPPKCVLARKEFLGLDMVEQLKATLQAMDPNNLE